MISNGQTLMLCMPMHWNDIIAWWPSRHLMAEMANTIKLYVLHSISLCIDEL